MKHWGKIKLKLNTQVMGYSLLYLFVDSCQKSYISEGVTFEQQEELNEITLSLCVQFSEHVAKIYFLLWNFLNCST